MRRSFLQKSEGAHITFLDETYGAIVAVKHKNGVNELPKGLNRNCTLVRQKDLSSTKTILSSQGGWNMDYLILPNNSDDKQGFAKYL